MADRLSGKVASWIINSIKIPITKMTPKITRALGDTTDSADYDSVGDMIAKTQIPISYYVEASVEGRFRKAYIPSSLLAILFTSATNLPVTFALDTGTIWGHGNFDISDFQTDVPVEEIVTYSCTIKSNGVFTPNS